MFTTVSGDSDEVQEWLKELKGFTIPNIAPTTDGSCVNNTAAAADAANRGWWTCGGYTRPSGQIFTVCFFAWMFVDVSKDIVACPDKYTWGVRSA